MTGITRRTAVLGLAAGLGLSLSACGSTGAAGRIRMACGEPGGLYLRFGELLRDAMRTHGAPELELLTTNGSAENLDLLARGEADLAIALADSAEAPGDLGAPGASGAAGASRVAIGRVYQNYLQCVVPAAGPVRSLADLAGRRVSIGAPGSGSSLTAGRVLDAARLLAGPVPPILGQHPLEDALRALGRTEIDAFFWSGGIPTPKIAELDRSTPLSLLDLGPAMPRLTAAYPEQYLPASVPVGVYSVAEATPTVGIPNLLLARASLADDTVRAVVDTLLDDAPRLVPEGSVGLQFLTGAGLIDTGTLPLHPAAQRRYRERAG